MTSGLNTMLKRRKQASLAELLMIQVMRACDAGQARFIPAVDLELPLADRDAAASGDRHRQTHLLALRARLLFDKVLGISSAAFDGHVEDAKLGLMGVTVLLAVLLVLFVFGLSLIHI